MVGIRQALSKLIPPEKARMMYHSYDLIGDVAVVKLPHELDDYEREVGEAIHEVHPRVARVFRVVGETEEVERNRELKLIWIDAQPGGTGGAVAENLGRTVYSEHGCKFVVDVSNVFFTPRLSYERMRIAKQVKPGETVSVMFGGVGTYAIIMAKVCPEVEKIYTIDVNPIAHKLANDNIAINHCTRKVVTILGDAGVVCKENLKGLCNRVIMPLPEYAGSFLDSAAAALKEDAECVINFYAEVSGRLIDKQIDKIIDEAWKKMRGCGVSLCEAVGWRIVREVGARRYHIAIDFRVLR